MYSRFLNSHAFLPYFISPLVDRVFLSMTIVGKASNSLGFFRKFDLIRNQNKRFSMIWAFIVEKVSLYMIKNALIMKQGSQAMLFTSKRESQKSYWFISSFCILLKFSRTSGTFLKRFLKENYLFFYKKIRKQYFLELRLDKAFFIRARFLFITKN